MIIGSAWQTLKADVVIAARRISTIVNTAVLIVLIVIILYNQQSMITDNIWLSLKTLSSRSIAVPLSSRTRISRKSL